MTNILSSPALEQFEKWLSHHELHWYFEDLPDFVQLAYYVKWLDEMNITIEVSMWKDNIWRYRILDEKYYSFTETWNTRFEALTAAVIKAGDIINERLLTK